MSARAPLAWRWGSSAEAEAGFSGSAALPIVMQRNRLLYGALGRAVGASTLLAAVLAVVVATAASPIDELVWFVGFAAGSAVRLSSGRTYRAHASDAALAPRFERRFIAGAALAGALWGAAALFLFPAGIVGRVFMAFVFAGVSAGAITSLGPSRPAAAAFLTLALVPLSLRLLLSGELVTVLMGGMTVLFWVFLIASSRQIAATLEENVRLRLAQESQERTLRRQKELLERVGRLAAVGGWEYDLATGDLEWSPEVFRIHGWDEREPPDLERALEFYQGEARSAVQAALKAAVEAGVPYDLELPFVAADGRRLWVRAQGQPQLTDGRVDRLTGAFQDITDRRMAEEALRTNLSALRRLFDITSTPGLSLEGKVDRILDLGLQFLDLDVGILSQVEGETYHVRAARGTGETPAPGTTFALGETYCVHTLASEGTTSFHHAGRSEIRSHPCYLNFGLEAYIGGPVVVDGARFGTVNFSSPRPRTQPFTAAEHGLVEAISQWIGFELSREQMVERLAHGERALASTLALKRAILDSANYAIIATDLDGTIQTFSRGAERMLGYRRDDLVGTATPLVLHDRAELAARASEPTRDGASLSDADAFQALVRNAAVQGSADEDEWTYRRADGTTLPVLLSITATRNEEGDRLGYLFVAADLTERKRVDRLQREFVSIVSHELRTPLTSIRASLGLVAARAAGALPERAHQLVQIAERNSKRLILLINDILDIDKIESGKMELVLRRQPLVPLVRQAVQTNTAFAREHEATLTFDAPDGDPWVLVDEHRMTQVLTNLISNAAKFSPPGAPVLVEITLAPATVRISVTDRGPGIPEAFRDRVFDKFSQADASDRRAKGGTGLGLSISRSLVHQMGGTIGFDSEPGSGTTFWVELARHDSPPAEP